MAKKTKQSVQALMIAIDWTTAKVVRIHTNQGVVLDAVTVTINNESDYQIRASVLVAIPAGTALYFVASDGFPGYYYLLRYNGTAFTCSCPLNAKFHKACDHQRAALAFVTARYEQRQAVERFIDQDIVQHLEDDARMARMERQFENLVSAVA